MKKHKLVKINDVWHVYDVMGGGLIAYIKSSTKSGALRQLARGLTVKPQA